jgi:hypothetical protein
VRSFKFIIKVGYDCEIRLAILLTLALENNTVLLTIIENVLPRFGKQLLTHRVIFCIEF